MGYIVESWVLVPAAGLLCHLCCGVLWVAIGHGVAVRCETWNEAAKYKQPPYKPKFSPIPEQMPARSYDPSTASVGAAGVAFKRRAKLTAFEVLGRHKPFATIHE